MLKIDIHTHILPKQWPDLKKKYGYGGFVQLEHDGPGCARMLRDGELFREIKQNCWDAGTRLAECDRVGVHMQVLSTVPVMFSYGARPAHALDLSRMLNDHIADLVQRHPARFVGLGTVPLQAPDLAIAEIERCTTELGLAGIQIGSHVNDWNLDDDQLFPVFQAAEALGAAVFVHPWDMLGKERMPKYWLPWLVGMPAETALAICAMIFGGVFDRLPGLRIAFAHGGGAFPGSIGRIEQGYRTRPDLCAVSHNGNPRQYLKRFYIDSLVHDARMLRYLIDLMGAERIAMGSDYPFPLGEQFPGGLIESIAFDAAARERLLSGTALEWLHLDRARFS